MSCSHTSGSMLLLQVVHEVLLRAATSPLSMAETSSSKRRGIRSSKWKDLPSDLLKAILPYLPISALGRGRAVCKSWNELISDMHFVYPSLKFALPEEYVYIGARSDALIAQEKLVLADIAKNRFIKVDDSFLTDLMVQEYGFIKLMQKFKDRRTLAADGGLFFVAYCTGKREGTELYVHNPVQKIIKPVPCPRFDWQWQLEFQRDYPHRCIKVVMATDKKTMHYEIFVFDIYTFSLQKLHIFDSRTGTWKQLRNIPASIIRHSVSVFINEQLHVLFQQHGSSDKVVMRFDKELNKFRVYGVNLPGHVLPAGAKRPSGDAHLVVHGAKLFYILIGILGATDPLKEQVEIFEVNLESNAHSLTASMPSEMVQLLFHGDEQHA